MKQSSRPAGSVKRDDAGYIPEKLINRQNWKRRWFVLRADRLAYYKDEKVSYPYLD
jgi:hypothetical protein